MAGSVKVQSSPERFEVIEVLLFLAASAVLFAHLPLVGYGYWGVDVFFIISGFVIMSSTQHGREGFFVKRLIRIVPLYWVLTLITFGVAFFLPQLMGSTSTDIVQLLKSMFFVPFEKNGAGHFPVLFVGWSLNFEMYFYAMFALGMRISMQYRGLATALLILVGFTISNFVTYFPGLVYSDPMVFEFVMGMLLYEHYHSRSSHLWLYVAIIATPVLAWFDLAFIRGYSIGVPCFVAVAFALFLFRQKRMPKFLVMLGGASYALYLTHPFVVQFVQKLTGLFSQSLAQNITVTVLVFIAANAIALAIFRWFETPLNRVLRRKLLAR